MGDSTSPIDRRAFLKYGGAASVVALAGCSGNGDDDTTDDGTGDGTDDGTATDEPDVDTITIGSNHPLTGFLGATGTRMDNAVQLAAMDKNADGGIESLGGAEVEVISGDNEGEQELGSEVAQELVDDGADILTGCFSSAVTSAATRVAERERVPFVISVSVVDAILQETPLEYVYRPQPRARQMAIDHAEMMPQIVRDAGMEIETAGLFHIDDVFGQSVRDALQELLPEQGVDVVETTSIGFGEGADTQVTRLREADPDAVIATSYAAGTQELLSAMDNQDYRPEILGGCANEALNDRGTLQEMGETANQALATNFALDPTDGAADDVRQRFEDEFDQSFDANVAMSYAAAQVILAAVEEAGSADHDVINDTLKEITVEDHIAAMPPVTFDDMGENENALAPLFQVQELEDRIIFPEEFAETSAQF